MDKEKTHFGFQTVDKDQKQSLVNKVFASVATKYDLMNDLMSFGIHRLWKNIAITNCALEPHHNVLDLAGGTGDLTSAIYDKLDLNLGKIVLADINLAMLQEGRNKLINQGKAAIDYVLTDGTKLPFQDNSFDCVIIAFGLRNILEQEKCLTEIYRVLTEGGRIVILEFSKANKNISAAYDFYSFNILPKIGKFIAQDEQSYQYLAESIRKHPDQETLLAMLQNCGFKACSFLNLTFGICAIHKGFKC